LSSETIGEALARATRLHADHVAVIAHHQQQTLTYRELHVLVDRSASGLLEMGVVRGDRIVVCSTNGVEPLVAFYAAATLGAVLVSVNPVWSATEVAYAVDKTGATVFMASSLQMLQDVTLMCPSLRHTVFLGTDTRYVGLRWIDLLNERARPLSASKRVGVDCFQPISVMFSSGTTGGLAKGATLSHHSLLNSGVAVGDRLGYGSTDRLCVPVPLYHVFGCVVGALAALTHGSAIVLPGPVFDAGTCVDAIDAHRCTVLYGVPAMFAALVEHMRIRPARFESLRGGVMAGAPCSEALLRRVTEIARIAEVTICYGMTEAGTICQSLPTERLAKPPGSVGTVHAHLECKIVDPVTRELLAVGQAGELWTRGYSTMSSYWADEEATRAVMERDGWLRTGDLASMDAEGHVSIVGRLKDVVISGGEKIHPHEVETVIGEHAAVAACAVVGIPDDSYGEVPCAWIELRPGSTLTSDELRRFCRGRLATYKVPRLVRVVEALPRTATGKIQRFRLREATSGQFLGLQSSPKRVR
jgi:fatty-acyl-CoA synthase